MTTKTLTYLAVLFLLGQLTSPLQAQETPADSLLALAEELFDQATALYEEGQYAESEEFYLRALAIEEEQYGLQSAEVGGTLYALGRLYAEQSRYVEAEEFYLRALAIEEDQYGPDSAEVADTRYFLVSV